MFVPSSAILSSVTNETQAIIIDCEHGHIDDGDMHAATAAIAALGVSPLVRIRSTHSDLIKRALDTGAQYVTLTRYLPSLTCSTSGIVVPQVDTAQEAASVVSHAKFPPQGFRGQGSPFPAIAHGVDVHTYMKTANETLITCLQIESKAGVENVDAICSVPGVGWFSMSPPRDDRRLG